MLFEIFITNTQVLWWICLVLEMELECKIIKISFCFLDMSIKSILFVLTAFPVSIGKATSNLLNKGKTIQ